MALVYAGTDVTAVKDKPAAFSQAPIVFPPTVTYAKTYTVSVDKATVDTTGTPDTNFTALIAAVDAALALVLAADFEDTLSNVDAAGRVQSFNLIGGSKYINTVNTGSYECQVDVDIQTVVI